MFNIEHKYAIELEMLVRKAFKCERFGVSGLANSDHFDYEPFDAAIMIISYLYPKFWRTSESRQRSMYFSTLYTGTTTLTATARSRILSVFI